MMINNKAREGWNWVSNSPKWHYFKADGRSLCGKWFTFGVSHEKDGDDSPDNCKACRKKVDKHRTTQNA